MVFDEYDKHEPILDSYEVDKIIDILRSWAYEHPRRNETFLFQMGRAWTPLEFLKEVEEHTSFGEDFLRFLFVQAQRSKEKPSDCVTRTVKANFG